MDYSLVVGVDSVRQELVVGIVGELIMVGHGPHADSDMRKTRISPDFVRTYTWDKRLENWVKDTAFLGGASDWQFRTPSVVTDALSSH